MIVNKVFSSISGSYYFCKMKYFCLIVSVVFFQPFFLVTAQKADCNLLEFIDTTAYYNGKKFSGKCIEKMNNSSKTEKERSYKQGLKHGQWTIWYPNGKKRYECEYLNNLKHGIERFYFENGNIESEINYRKGKKNGRWTVWYENGQKYYEVSYSNNVREGKWFSWHSNGKKASEVVYRGGKKTGREISWKENGELLNEKDHGDPSGDDGTFKKP